MSFKEAVVIGGGHNGLVCAAYLARSGVSVTVVEARDELGGAAGAYEYLPGFRASMTNSPGSLESLVVQELELEKYGLRFIAPPVTLIHPFEGSTFVGWRDRKLTDEQFEKYAPGEANRYRSFVDSLNRLGANSGLSLWERPPMPDVIRQRLEDEQDRSLFDQLVYGSLDEVLDSKLKSDEAKALMAMLAVNGQMVSPKEPGTAIGLLMRPISMASSSDPDPHSPNRSPLRGSVGLPVGSMSAIVEALKRVGAAAGVTYVTGKRVRRVTTGDSGATGVELEDGRFIGADAVVSTVEPSILLNELVDAAALGLSNESVAPPEGSAFKIALALDSLPGIANLPPELPAEVALQSQVRIGPSLGYIYAAIHDAISSRPSKGPIMWGLVPSVTSEGLAPRGKHLFSVNVWHAPHSLGREYWAEHKDEFGRRCIEILDEHMPGLGARIEDYSFLSPTEIADELSLTGSNITHGNMLPSSLLGNRPHRVLSDYATPLEGLFLGGAGVWPGGYVTGAPGRNAASRVKIFLESKVIV